MAIGLLLDDALAWSDDAVLVSVVVLVCVLLRSSWHEAAVPDDFLSASQVGGLRRPVWTINDPEIVHSRSRQERGRG